MSNSFFLHETTKFTKQTNVFSMEKYFRFLILCTKFRMFRLFVCFVFKNKIQVALENELLVE